MLGSYDQLTIVSIPSTRIQHRLNIQWQYEVFAYSFTVLLALSLLFPFFYTLFPSAPDGGACNSDVSAHFENSLYEFMTRMTTKA